MLIAVPAGACGGSPPCSVLDLEPLIELACRCRPDAVALLPPPGADDLPNGAALLAIRNRLDAEGLRSVGGALEVGAEAPVTNPSWRIESLFGARALVAALGEAAVEPLALVWRPRIRRSVERDALRAYLDGLVEEAERSRVRIALCAGGAAGAAAYVREAGSGYLHAGADLGADAAEAAGAALLLVRVPVTSAVEAARLPSAEVAVLYGPGSPEEYAAAVERLRGTRGA